MESKLLSELFSVTFQKQKTQGLFCLNEKEKCKREGKGQGRANKKADECNLILWNHLRFCLETLTVAVASAPILAWSPSGFMI